MPRGSAGNDRRGPFDTGRSASIAANEQADHLDAVAADRDHDARTSHGPIRVMLIDELEIWRAGLRSVLEAAGGIRVVGEIQAGDKAPGEVARARPDVLLLDVIQRHATNLLWEVRSTHPMIHVIVMTLAVGDLVLFSLAAAGVRAVLSKRASRRELVSTVRTVAEGHSLVEPPLVGRIRPSSAEWAADDKLATLSGRERSVLQLLVQGLGNTVIASELDLSPLTVKNHVASILSKLGVSRRGEATAYVAEHMRRGGSWPGS